MPMLVSDPFVEIRLKAEREASGADRWDEVWEGPYMMAPLPNDEHQDLVGRLNTIFQLVGGFESGAFVRPGVNVSDLLQGWEHNYRCPDVVVYLVHPPGTWVRTGSAARPAAAPDRRLPSRDGPGLDDLIGSAMRGINPNVRICGLPKYGGENG